MRKKPTEEEFKRMYVQEGMNLTEIAEQTGWGYRTIRGLRDEYGFARRTNSEVQLKGRKKPTREEFKRMYVQEGMALKEIAKKTGFGYQTILEWRDKYGFARKTMSEVRLRGKQKPTKEELREMLAHGTITEVAEKTGLSDDYIAELRDEYGIERKTMSEVMLRGRKKPTREELKEMLANGTIREVAEQRGVSYSTIRNWRDEYSISSRKSQRIKTASQLVAFLEDDETARNLAASAVGLNGDGVDLEKIMMEMYEGRFENQAQLHALLKESTRQVYELIRNGVTNLGAFIGEFSLDRRVVPVLISQAVDSIPEEQIKPSLEERFVRVLRTYYSPGFNRNPQSTIKTIREKASSSEGRKKLIYLSLADYFEDVIKLGEELS